MCLDSNLPASNERIEYVDDPCTRPDFQDNEGKKTTMISTREDEPEFVKAYSRKALQFVLVIIVVAITLGIASALLPVQPPLQGLLFLGVFVPVIVFGIWMRRAYPPVREWRKAWMKEHRVSQHHSNAEAERSG
jgi:hypothetical protein